jgi:hypothetical protein
MKTFLKIVRWQNLLIIILTMILMRYAVLRPVLSRMNVFLYDLPGQMTNMSLQLAWYDFVILVMATVLISAGG